jgi:hypothetical protein
MSGVIKRKCIVRQCNNQTTNLYIGKCNSCLKKEEE